MNIDIARLKTSRPPHPLKSFFSRYNRTALAETLGVSPGYFSNVMGGHLPPSADLENRMKELKEAIITAEKAEA
jgi:hypothetical protein